MASALVRNPGRHCVRIIVAALALIVLSSPLALADGDPASDVLLGEDVFYPYSPQVSPAIQKALGAETAAARKAGFPLKVALIGSPVDLGVIPDLFGKPQKYAGFLDQEISFQGKQRLLVVMAAGYGAEGLSPPGQHALASLSRPAGTRSDDLARAATVAVGALAKAEGHPLKGVPNPSGSGTGATAIVVILGLGAAAVAAALAAVTIRRRRAEAG